MSDSTERELDYAFVRDMRLNQMRVTFVRLVRATADADAMPTATYYSEDAHLDVDDEGNVMGITLFIRTEPVGVLKRLPMLNDEELEVLRSAVHEQTETCQDNLKLARSDEVKEALGHRWAILNSLRTAITETRRNPPEIEGSNAVE